MLSAVIPSFWSTKPPRTPLTRHETHELGRAARCLSLACALVSGAILWFGLAIVFSGSDGRVPVAVTQCKVSAYRDPVTGRTQTGGLPHGTGNMLACRTP